jgi:hypothetical protein
MFTRFLYFRIDAACTSFGRLYDRQIIILSYNIIVNQLLFVCKENSREPLSREYFSSRNRFTYTARCC